jgi:transposase InsO family protein
MQKKIMETIEITIQRTGWKRTEVISRFGISSSQISRWRRGTTRRPNLVYPFRVLDEEIQEVIAYRTSSEENRDLGYRKLTWKMVDEDVVYLSESSIYRILRLFKLLGRAFKENDGALKEYENKPKYVHHHWHTDIAYVILGGIHYYLIFMLDGFSRFLLHWELMTDMSGPSVEIFTQKTIDKYPEARPMVIHDNGSQFIGHDFKRILFENNCTDVPTRMKHPETNGKAERFVGLIRSEALRPNSPSYYGEGVRVIEKYVDEYNNKRYHAGIGYLKPVDVFHGRGPAILAERREKLKRARKERFEKNRELNSILLEGLPA